MPQPEYFNPASAGPTPPRFSQVVRWGNIVWLSGQQARDESGNIVGPGDAEAQARQIFRRLENILKELGGDLNSIVKTVTYVVGRENIAARGKVLDELREAGIIKNLPASTVVLVSGFVAPESLMEMDCIAVIE